EDFTVTIAWGDGGGSVSVLQQPDGSFPVQGSHTYEREGTYTLDITVHDDGGQVLVIHGGTALVSGTAADQQRSQDPARGLLVPLGEVSVALNQGGLRLSHGLDFDQSPGTAVGGEPALVYNSGTVGVRPIVQAVLALDPDRGRPATIQARLTWNDH